VASEYTSLGKPEDFSLSDDGWVTALLPFEPSYPDAEWIALFQDEPTGLDEAPELIGNTALKIHAHESKLDEYVEALKEQVEKTNGAFGGEVLTGRMKKQVRARVERLEREQREGEVLARLERLL
jgi:hypothetical protein